MLETVGRVVGLWRYPVKSMAAQALAEAAVGKDGFAGDRRWSFVRPDMEASPFPWLTLRQRPDLHGFRPAYDDPSCPDTSSVTVTTPDGNTLPLTDPALADELGGDGVQGVRRLPRDTGVFDTLPLSLLTTATLAGLQEVVDPVLDVRRFRPNLLVEPVGGGAFPEDAWVGRTLRVGGVRLHVDERDRRCAVIGVDPETGRLDPGVLRAVVRGRQGCAGVYGSTVSPGTVRPGDAVLLEPGWSQT